MTDISPRVNNVLDTDCARTVGEFLAEASTDELDQLVALLDSDAEVQSPHAQRAIYLLGRSGKATAVDAIVKVIPKLSKGARVAAVDALGRLGGDSARTAVLALSSDADPQVRKFSVTALGRLGGNQALQRLQQIVDEDQEDFVRATAAKRLKRM